MITQTHYTVLSAALFMIGVAGVMARRNIIIIFMSIELMFVKMGVPTSSVELVNYQSSQDATTAVIKGETEFTLGDVVTSIAAMETGKIRVLAVAGEKRSPKFPNVPTAAEAGLSNYVDQPHVGVYAPGGTPADIMTKLNAAVNRALANDRLLFLALQTSDTEDPQPSDLRTIGTIAAIRQMAKAPNGNINVIVEGLQRGRADIMTRTANTLRATSTRPTTPHSATDTWRVRPPCCA